MGICSLTWGTHLQLTVTWGPHRATVCSSAPLVSSNSIALYASKQPLRSVLQTKNCPRGFVQMCLRLLWSLRLFFQSRETNHSMEQTHDLTSSIVESCSLSRPQGKSAQGHLTQTHRPLKMMDRGDGNECHSGSRHQEGSKHQVPFLISNQLPHCFLQEWKTFVWVTLSAFIGTWGVF